MRISQEVCICQPYYFSGTPDKEALVVVLHCNVPVTVLDIVGLKVFKLAYCCLLCSPIPILQLENDKFNRMFYESRGDAMKAAAFTVQRGEQKAVGRHDSRLSVSKGEL